MDVPGSEVKCGIGSIITQVAGLYTAYVTKVKSMPSFEGEKKSQPTYHQNQNNPLDAWRISSHDLDTWLGSPPIYWRHKKNGHLEGVPRCPILRGRKPSPWCLLNGMI